MPLTLSLKTELKIPLEVDGVNPTNLVGLDTAQVKEIPIWCGRTQRPIGDFFDVDGQVDEDQTIVWTGDLGRVQRLGEQMAAGTMRVRGNVGRHAGFKMTGGRIEVLGDASDYLGAEMTGGTIAVSGNAGDNVGTWFSGEKFGMNRGQIFVRGSAGNGLGQGMRRGTIVVGESVGKLAGWNMLAGTIVCFGDCGPHPGAGMKRGTIVIAGDDAVADAEKKLLPTFLPGANFTIPILQYLKNWIAQANVGGEAVFQSEQLETLGKTFQTYHGDQLQGGRGELFFAS